MSLFEPALAFVLKNEGGLVENPKDPGGITNRGISLRFLQSIENPAQYGFHAPVTREDIINLTDAQTSALYQGEFWNKAPFSRIISQLLANYIFDAACNLGIAPAIKIAQRATWAARKDMSVTPDDGILGDHTLMLLNTTSTYLLLSAIRSERAGEYRLIVEHQPAESEFLCDWLKRAYTS